VISYLAIDKMRDWKIIFQKAHLNHLYLYGHCKLYKKSILLDNINSLMKKFIVLLKKIRVKVIKI